VRSEGVARDEQHPDAVVGELLAADPQAAVHPADEQVGQRADQRRGREAGLLPSGARAELAADQRGSGKLFGVRWGREWRYPKFQFDSGRQLYPEMKSVLSALSPDQQGWDRLQWFLHPHERLNGRTPLQVWKSDRQKVIEAAHSERWDGRD